MEGSNYLHLDKLDGKKLSRELLLAIPNTSLWRSLGDEWYNGPREACSSGDCEPALNSKVQIVRVSRTSFMPFHRRRINSISGNFEIELKYGRKFAGSFEAQLRKATKLDLCL